MSVEWIKLNSDKYEAIRQLEPYKDIPVYIAVFIAEEFVDMDIWDGTDFQEYSLDDVRFFAPVEEMPEYPYHLED